MKKYERFFQMNADCFMPFNEAPAYLKGSVTGSADDKIEISGRSSFQENEWHKMGCLTQKMSPHSFAFSVDAMPTKAVGSYQIGIQGDCSINVSHFVRSSVRLLTPQLAENAYSGWGYDNSGRRTQQGVPAPWESIGKRHNLMVSYDAVGKRLRCFVNGFQIHQVNGTLGEFSLAIRFEAVAIEGEFAVSFENISYFSIDTNWESNISRLKAWDPQFAPVFISYSHKDKPKVEPFVSNLKRSCVRVLGDWDFKPGDSLMRRITHSISRAGYLLVMLSPNSVTSPWVERELQLGITRELKERRVHVVPIMVEDCDLPLFLSDKLCLTLDESDTTVNRLLDALRRAGTW